jgi:hypothetical protein
VLSYAPFANHQIAIFRVSKGAILRVFLLPFSVGFLYSARISASVCRAMLARNSCRRWSAHVT